MSDGIKLNIITEGVSSLERAAAAFTELSKAMTATDGSAKKVSPATVKLAKSFDDLAERLGVSATKLLEMVKALKEAEKAMSGLQKMSRPFTKLSGSIGKVINDVGLLNKEMLRTAEISASKLGNQQYMTMTQNAKANIVLQQQLNAEIEKQGQLRAKIAMQDPSSLGKGRSDAVLRANVENLKQAQVETGKLISQKEKLLAIEKRTESARIALKQGGYQVQINAENAAYEKQAASIQRIQSARAALKQGGYQAQINAETVATEKQEASLKKIAAARIALKQGGYQAQINAETVEYEKQEASIKKIKASRDALRQGNYQAQINAETTAYEKQEASIKKIRASRDALKQGNYQSQINAENAAYEKQEAAVRKIKAARESLRQGAYSAQIRKEEQAYQTQSAAVAKLKQRLDSLKGTRLPEAEFRRLQKAIHATNVELARTGKAQTGGLASISTQLRKLEGDFTKTGKSATKFGTNMKYVAGGIARSFGAMTYSYAALAPLLAGIFAGGTVKKVYELGTAFEYTTTYVDALGDSLSKLDAGTIQKELLSMDTMRKGPQEMALGMKEFAKAGVEAAKSLGQIEEMARFATIAEMELADASKLVIGQSQAFEQSFAKSANMIAAAALSSATDIGEMATALSYTTELATVSKVSFEEVATAMAIMANAGIRGCYDKETEVLTKDGWKFWKDVTEEDLFATYNEETGNLEYQLADRLIRYHHRGQMYKVSNKGIDLCVTPDHRMFVKKRDKDSFEVLTAEEVEGKTVRYKTGGIGWQGVSPSEIILPGFSQNRGNWEKEIPSQAIDAKLWATFLGWYIADGHCYKDNGGNYKVVITKTSKKQKMQTKMQSLFDQLPWTYNYTKSTGQFTFTSQQFFKALEPLGKVYQKHIPQYAKDWDTELLTLLFTALFECDGCNDIYYTSSVALRDDVQEVALKLGYTTLFRKTMSKGDTATFTDGRTITAKEDGWKVSVTKSRTEPWWNPSEYKGIHGARLNGSPIEIFEGWVDYDDEVFCAEVPNSLLIVRRNGRAVVSCNSKAGTAIRTSMVRLQAPSQKLKGMLDELGISWSAFTEDGQVKSMTAAFSELKRVTEHLTDVEKVPLIKELFGLRAMKGGANVLRSMGDEWDNMLEKISAANDGVTFIQQTYEKLGDTVRAKLQNLGAEFEKSLIKAFESEGIKGAIDNLNKLVASDAFVENLTGIVNSINELANATTYIVSLTTAFKDFADVLGAISRLDPFGSFFAFKELMESGFLKDTWVGKWIQTEMDWIDKGIEKLGGYKEAAQLALGSEKRGVSGVKTIAPERQKLKFLAPEIEFDADLQKLRAKIEKSAEAGNNLAVAAYKRKLNVLESRMSSELPKVKIDTEVTAEIREIKLEIDRALEAGADRAVFDLKQKLIDIEERMRVEAAQNKMKVIAGVDILFEQSEMNALDPETLAAFNEELDKIDFSGKLHGLEGWARTLEETRQKAVEWGKAQKDALDENHTAVLKLTDAMVQGLVNQGLAEVKRATEDLTFENMIKGLKDSKSAADNLKGDFLKLQEDARKFLDMKGGIKLDSTEGKEYFRTLIESTGLFEDAIESAQNKVRDLQQELKDTKFDMDMDIFKAKANLYGASDDRAAAAVYDRQLAKVKELQAEARVAGSAGIEGRERQLQLLQQAFDLTKSMSKPADTSKYEREMAAAKRDMEAANGRIMLYNRAVERYTKAKNDLATAERIGTDLQAEKQRIGLLEQIRNAIVKNKEEGIKSAQEEKENVKKYVEEAKKSWGDIEKSSEAAKEIAEGYGIVLTQNSEGIKIWSQVANEAIKSVTIAQEKLNKITAAYKPPKTPSGGTDGSRAAGGPVTGGNTYLVGERGPELFSPKASGFITPNHELTRSNNKDSIDINLVIGNSEPIPVRGDQNTLERIKKAQREQQRYAA